MKILYAEDELPLSMAVTEILKMEHYEVENAYDGADAWEKLERAHYDAVILDIMMPKLDGIQVLQRMRNQKDYTPVLLLTAKTQIEDRVAGLSSGADDYLDKPFSMEELLARLQAILRRSQQYRITRLQYGNSTLDCDTEELVTDQGSLRLSSMETSLLSLLMNRPEQCFTGQQLIGLLSWEQQENGTLLLYVAYLNNKLQQIHASIEITQTEQGFMLRRKREAKAERRLP